MFQSPRALKLTNCLCHFFLCTCTCRRVFCRFWGSVSPLGLAMLWFCSWVLSQEWRDTTSSWYCWYLSSSPDRRPPNSEDCERRRIPRVRTSETECRASKKLWLLWPTLVCKFVYLWFASCSLSVTTCLVLPSAGSEPPTCSWAPWMESRTFWPEIVTKRRSALWQMTSSPSCNANKVQGQSVVVEFQWNM